MGNITTLNREIFKTITNDSTIIGLLGLTNSSADTKGKRIQKRRKPVDIIENLPILSYYSPGGEKDPNNVIYNATIVFDVYTQDTSTYGAVDRAQDISDRLEQMFNNELVSLGSVTSYTTHLVESYESLTDLPDTYCYTTVLVFSIDIGN